MNNIKLAIVDDYFNVVDIDNEYENNQIFEVVKNVILKESKYISHIKSITDNVFCDQIFNHIDNDNIFLELYEHNRSIFQHMYEVNTEKIIDIMRAIAYNENSFYFYDYLVQCFFDYEFDLEKIYELINASRDYGQNENMICRCLLLSNYYCNIPITEFLYEKFEQSNGMIKNMNHYNFNSILSSKCDDDEKIEYLKYIHSINCTFIKKESNGSELYPDNVSSDIFDYIESIISNVCRFKSCPSCRINLTIKPCKLFIETTSKCVICLDTINEPHALECGHVYCKECLY